MLSGTLLSTGRNKRHSPSLFRDKQERLSLKERKRTGEDGVISRDPAECRHRGRDRREEGPAEDDN